MLKTVLLGLLLLAFVIRYPTVSFVLSFLLIALSPPQYQKGGLIVWVLSLVFVVVWRNTSHLRYRHHHWE